MSEWRTEKHIDEEVARCEEVSVFAKRLKDARNKEYKKTNNFGFSHQSAKESRGHPEYVITDTKVLKARAYIFERLFHASNMEIFEAAAWLLRTVVIPGHLREQSKKKQKTQEAYAARDEQAAIRANRSFRVHQRGETLVKSSDQYMARVKDSPFLHALYNVITSPCKPPIDIIYGTAEKCDGVPLEVIHFCNERRLWLATIRSG